MIYLTWTPCICYRNVQETRPAAHTENLENAEELWRISLTMTNLSDEEVHPKLKW